ncbi:MAG TPA: alanyl-tRNA editing protein, partial [Fusibacter sp.]|nr:alanyl-tRNA editing protein [Fusibacter sp.]
MACGKVFWENPYLTELEAYVTSVNGDVVTLDQTIFYAFSGGQQSDSGTIEGLTVLGAEKENFEIYYTLPNGH